MGKRRYGFDVGHIQDVEQIREGNTRCGDRNIDEHLSKSAG
ncbi:MAG: hypothetical protein QXT45_06655 [Candidatus Bilamarchaeaceae archaeon]